MSDEIRNVEQAKAAYNGTKRLVFAEIPPLDLLDRVSLLTVAAGLRRIGVLEGDGIQVGQIRDALGNRGILSSVSSTVWTVRDEAVEDDDLLRLLRSLRDAKPKRQSVLWVFFDADARREVKGREISKTLAGRLLSYPNCCVEANEGSGREMDRRFLKALAEKVGPDKEAIKKAIVDDIGVEFDETGLGMGNVAATTGKFPFVSHVCCDACLTDPASPSSRLNSAYEALVKDVDPALHRAMVEVSKLVSELDSSGQPETIFSEVERIHRSVLSSRGA